MYFPFFCILSGNWLMLLKDVGLINTLQFPVTDDAFFINLRVAHVQVLFYDKFNICLLMTFKTGMLKLLGKKQSLKDQPWRESL